MSEGKFVATEFGPIWKPGKPQKAPEGGLKKRCYAALTKWAADNPDTPIKMVRISVGHFDSPDGKHYALGTVGAGDFLVAIAGTTLMVETKSATGRQSDGQRRMEAAWRATSNHYLVVREPHELTDTLTQIAAQKGFSK